MSNRRHGKGNKRRRRGRSPPQKMRVLPSCARPGAGAGRGGRKARADHLGDGHKAPWGSSTDPCTCPAPQTRGGPSSLPEPADPGAFCREVRPQVRRGTSAPEPAGQQLLATNNGHPGPPAIQRVKNEVTATALAATMSDRSVCAGHLTRIIPQSRGRTPKSRGSTATKRWNWDLDLPPTSPRRRC